MSSFRASKFEKVVSRIGAAEAESWGGLGSIDEALPVWDPRNPLSQLSPGIKLVGASADYGSYNWLESMFSNLTSPNAFYTTAQAPAGSTQPSEISTWLSENRSLVYLGVGALVVFALVK